VTSSTTEPAAAPGTVRSIERAIDVLQALERADAPLRLVDISKETGLHSATALRMLAVLQHRGLVVAEDQAYRLGAAALGLAHGFLATDPVSRDARPVMQQLSAVTGMTVSLYLRIDLERILIARVDGENPLRYQIPIGRRLPLALGSGKVIAALLEDDEREALLATTSGYRRPDGSWVSREEVTAEFEQANRQGYFVTIGDRDLAVGAISVPLRTSEGAVAGSLSLSSPAESLTTALLMSHLPELQRASASIRVR
jgi:IclR family pca regulon transcriptional regulator/IclR family acetate operon transcriptional repressor